LAGAIFLWQPDCESLCREARFVTISIGALAERKPGATFFYAVPLLTFMAAVDGEEAMTKVNIAEMTPTL
jgi:hypothetical protein